MSSLKRTGTRVLTVDQEGLNQSRGINSVVDASMDRGTPIMKSLRRLQDAFKELG